MRCSVTKVDVRDCAHKGSDAGCNLGRCYWIQIGRTQSQTESAGLINGTVARAPAGVIHLVQGEGVSIVSGRGRWRILCRARPQIHAQEWHGALTVIMTA